MKKYLGIELGSTRIKAVLIDEQYAPIVSGEYSWESTFLGGYWTYSLDDVQTGVQTAYAALAKNYREKTGEILTALDGLGVSAMMHGYLAFDKNDTLLVPFRTWRNTTTEQSAAALTELFGFNIPQRWSIAHLYQAVLGSEPHIGDISYLTTLSGYVHSRLTGEKVLGVGDASGMFPVSNDGYDVEMAGKFRELTGLDITKIMPQVLKAGENAGTLTAEGAKWIDPSGSLIHGAPACPPEGDAGTGMVATNSIAAHTGNVSAGTSVFAMLVLEKPLSMLYTEVDMVTTPTGLPVAMIHCNSCTSDLDAWVKLLGEAATLMGAEFDKTTLYNALFGIALKGEQDGGGLLNYNYYSGEPITELTYGRPLFTRLPDSRLSLADFMRVQLYSCIATLKIGMDILIEKEQVRLDLLTGHGGFFKVPKVGQTIMADVLNIPVAVMESAGEGGAWGIALLSAYMSHSEKQSLEEFLSVVFSEATCIRTPPNEKNKDGINRFIQRYLYGLDIERTAVRVLN